MSWHNILRHRRSWKVVTISFGRKTKGWRDYCNLHRSCISNRVHIFEKLSGNNFSKQFRIMNQVKRYRWGYFYFWYIFLYALVSLEEPFDSLIVSQTVSSMSRTFIKCLITFIKKFRIIIKCLRHLSNPSYSASSSWSSGLWKIIILKYKHWGSVCH